MKGAPFIQGTPSGTVEESVFPSLCRSLWRGRLVLVGGVGSECFLIPGLLVWTLVWVGGVGCWRGISKFRRGNHYPCEVKK